MSAPDANRHTPGVALRSTYANLGKRIEIANHVRTAAIAAVKGVSIGEGLLSQIVDRATDDLHGSSWTQRSLSERIQIAAGIAEQYVRDAAARPLNYSSATPKELETQRLAQNVGQVAAMYRFAQVAGAEGGREGSGGSAGSNRGGVQYGELSGAASGWSNVSTGAGSGFSWLSTANQHVPGFTREQVAGAANFLKGAGVDRETVNDDTRHMVHLKKYQPEILDLIRRRQDIERRRAAGEDVTDSERELGEVREKTRKEMNKKERDHLDRMKSINGPNRKDAEHNIDAARESTGQQLAQRREGTPQARATTVAQNTSARKDQKNTDDEASNIFADALGVGLPDTPKTATNLGASRSAEASLPSSKANEKTGGAEPVREAKNSKDAEQKVADRPSPKSNSGPTPA